MRDGGSDDLEGRLGSTDRRRRREACDDVRGRLDAEPGLLPSLQAILKTGASLARLSAASILFEAGHADLRLLRPLLDALELSDGDLRWSAARMLTALGRLHAEVFPVLAHEAVSPDAPSLRRAMALHALRELGPERPETSAALVLALGDASVEVRRAALSCLAKGVEPPRGTQDRVRQMARADPDPGTRAIASHLYRQGITMDPSGDG